MRLGRWERSFGYRCVLTCAQIELMQADLPHTLWKDHKTRSAEKANTEVSEKVLRLQEEAIRKARERREKKDGESSYNSVDELFE